MRVLILLAIASLSGCLSSVSTDPCDGDLKIYCTAVEDGKKLKCLSQQWKAGISLSVECLEKLYEMNLLDK
jgi:hypothetical protein